MSYNERLRKASKYCERNGSYRVIAGCGEKKILLVRNATGYVRTALLGEGPFPRAGKRLCDLSAPRSFGIGAFFYGAKERLAKTASLV